MSNHKGIKNVVLAEDDLDDALIFRLALDKLPIAVELRHVENGEKLLYLLKQLVPDIIFLDIRMPCKDGIACIVEIRKNQQFDQVPVIMYTSVRNKKYIDDSYSNGANLYLVKANTIQELAERLLKILSMDWKTYMYYPPKSGFVIGNVLD